jgi:hypothetical protein
MRTKNTKLIGLLILLGNATTLAHATAPGFYVGAQAGSTNLNNKAQTVQTGLSAPATQLVMPSNTGIGERFFIGTGINPYAAAELGYTYYAPSTYKPSPSNLANTPSIRENGVDLVAKIMYPIQKTAVFGKVGVIRISKSVSGSLQPLSPTEPRLKTTMSYHPLIGIGASYDLTPSWVADISWTRALKGGNGFQNADFIGIGISYHFVDRYCGQFLC